MSLIQAEIVTPQLRAVLRPAPPLTLHDRRSWRTDGNSPALADADGITVFYSDYEPRGHTLRRRGSRDLAFAGDAVPVRLLDDADPQVGKWIEAVRRDGAGRLRGWYHAEELAPCSRRLFVPHIGEVVSHDGGSTWRCRGEVLRAPPDQIDCDQRNGFVAGGYGDLCVIADRRGRHLYMPFTSYVADESAQGVVIARLPATRPTAPGSPPGAGLELWSAHGWQPATGQLPRPIWRPVRGFRHPDPDAFWGPAVHYNRALDAYVMLLNHTAGGAGNLLQEGIYVSVNRDLEDPAGWSAPVQFVRGGAWYPQAFGIDEGCCDVDCGARARFFMAGFSAWEIEFAVGGPTDVNRPLRLTKADFAVLFGAASRSPW